jgi:hypothetical protein
MPGPGIEGGVAVGDEAVQRSARRGAVLGVVVAGSLAAAAGGEELSIRGRGAAVAPDCSEGLSMLGVDQGRGRRRISLGPDMALDHQHHLRRVTPRELSAMRSTPELVASAMIAAISATGSAAISPLR